MNYFIKNLILLLGFFTLVTTCIDAAEIEQKVSKDSFVSIASKVETITLNEENTVILRQGINYASIAKVQVKLFELSKKNPTNDLYLFLDSPGGSVAAGGLLIDTINSIPNKVHTISAFSASMAYITAQSLGKRYVLPSGVLMSHRAYVGGLKGTFEQIDSLTGMLKEMVKEYDIQCADRVGLSYNAYRTLIHDDHWMTARQAVSTGHADAIAKVICDKSLQGSYVERQFSLFGAYDVTFSKCPLVRGYIKYKPVRRFTTKENLMRFKQVIDKKYLDRTRDNITLTL